MVLSTSGTYHFAYIPIWSNSPNWELENICGHTFVIHFHTIKITGHKTINGYTNNLINPNVLDCPLMTSKWPRIYVFLSMPLSQSHFLLKNVRNMENLSFDFEKGTIEYISKIIGVKSTEWRRSVKVEDRLCIFSSIGKHVCPTKMTIISFWNPTMHLGVAILNFWGQRSSQIWKIGHNFATKEDIGLIFYKVMSTPSDLPINRVLIIVGAAFVIRKANMLLHFFLHKNG